MPAVFLEKRSTNEQGAGVGDPEGEAADKELQKRKRTKSHTETQNINRGTLPAAHDKPRRHPCALRPPSN